MAVLPPNVTGKEIIQRPNSDSEHRRRNLPNISGTLYQLNYLSTSWAQSTTHLYFFQNHICFCFLVANARNSYNNQEALLAFSAWCFLLLKCVVFKSSNKKQKNTILKKKFDILSTISNTSNVISDEYFGRTCFFIGWQVDVQKLNQLRCFFWPCSVFSQFVSHS